MLLVITATSTGMTDAITTAGWRPSRDLLRPGPASLPPAPHRINPFHQRLYHAYTSLIDKAGNTADRYDQY